MNTLQNAPNHVSRRNFLQLAAGAAGTAAFANALIACSETLSSSSGSVTLNYWDWYVSQAPWVNEEIKLFQQAHPKIRIKKATIGTDTYATLLALAIKSNNAPDVFMIPQRPNSNEQVAEGWLLPVDKWANNAWRSRFPQGTFHEGNNIFNGKLYSAPLSGNAPWLQLYINENVFKAANLVDSHGNIVLPQTWDDVTHAAETIGRKSNGSIYGLGFGNGAFNLLRWWLEIFIRGAGSPGGADGLDLRVGKYTYSSDRTYTDFLSLWTEWKKKGYFYPSSMNISDEAARAFFELGRFGMTVGGVWNQPEWTKHHFVSYNLTTLPSPQVTKKGYFYYTPGGMFIAISPQTKHPDKAWAWFDWIYSPEAGKRWVAMGEDLSVFQQNNDPGSIKFKPFAQYVGMHNYSLPGPDISIRNPQLSHVIIPPIKPDIGDVLANIYTGQIGDIQSALSEVADRSQEALENGIKKAQQQGYKVSINDYIFSDWAITQPYYTKQRQSLCCHEDGQPVLR